MDIFVTCGPNLEPLLFEELLELGYTQLIKGFRGVYVKDISLEAIYQINYNSRIASRVLLPISHFNCWDRDSLYKCASKIDWQSYLPMRKTFAIDANVSHPKLRHSLFAAQVVKDAICDQFVALKKERPSVNVHAPDVQINLFVQNSKGILSIDTSGSPLHQRGYRQKSVQAPLRETLAAALLRLAKYQKNERVIDPCCGSATFLIEAALMASNIAPGFLRKRWGFQLLPDFSFEKWLKVKNESDAKRSLIAPGMLLGLDSSKEAILSAEGNAKAAGLHKMISFERVDFRQYEPKEKPTFLICNPPYGNRLDNEEQLIPLYRSLGDWMKRKMNKPSRGFILCGSPTLSKEVGLAAKRRHPIDNGGIDSRFLEFDLY